MIYNSLQRVKYVLKLVALEEELVKAKRWQQRRKKKGEICVKCSDDVRFNPHKHVCDISHILTNIVVIYLAKSLGMVGQRFPYHFEPWAGN